MSVIWTNRGSYRRVKYNGEADLERAILQIQLSLFGEQRIYLPVKKRIGAKDGPKNIPDGYLIDLSGAQPRLYVVENELAVHDPLRHIAVQILQFSLRFATEGHGVKKIIFDALQDQPELKKRCENYALNRQFRNLDRLLEFMIFETPFAALVIIDELLDDLETVLAEKFRFGVEVLEVARYQNSEGEQVYRFEPFLENLTEDLQPAEKGEIDTVEIDTVVVPSKPDGLDVFLGEKRWYAIRIHGTMRPQIKYIALYQSAPTSAITYIASVKSIQPWKDTGKFVVNFVESAQAIGPIPLVKNSRVKALQNLRYTTRKRIMDAKTLDDIW